MNTNFGLIIPCKNEKQNITLILSLIEKFSKSTDHIFVVVDNENDSTFAGIDEGLNERIKVHKVLNKHIGISGAIKTVLEKNICEIVGVYPCDEILTVFSIDKFFHAIKVDGFDLVSASRYSFGGKRHGGNWTYRIFSYTGNLLFRILSLNSITDLTTGMKFWKVEEFTSKDFESSGSWNSLSNLTIKAFKNKSKYLELPIVSVDRPFNEGESSFKNYQIVKWVYKYLVGIIKAVINAK
jgi:glycosyltransferase involved in cell wall biosynthesis